MNDIEQLVDSIRSDYKGYSYDGYKVEGEYLYVCLIDDKYDTGDGINIVRMNLKTGKTEESQGFIVAVEDWKISLRDGWHK